MRISAWRCVLTLLHWVSAKHVQRKWLWRKFNRLQEVPGRVLLRGCTLQLIIRVSLNVGMRIIFPLLMKISVYLNPNFLHTNQYATP